MIFSLAIQALRQRRLHRRLLPGSHPGADWGGGGVAGENQVTL